MEKLVIVVISLILLTESLDRKHVTHVYVYINDMFAFCNGSCNLGRKCIISEERFVLELPTSCAMLSTARPLVLRWVQFIQHWYYQEIDCEKHLQSDLFCVKCDVNRQFSQSVNTFFA